MTPAALQVDYLSLDQLGTRSPAWWGDVLGVVGFAKLPPIEQSEVPVTASMTPSLGTADTLCEVWRVEGAASGQLRNDSPNGQKHAEVRYRFCEEFLFGSVSIQEQPADAHRAIRGAVGNAASLSRATMAAYREIFRILEATEHRHLIRVWNYLPEINRETDGDERYRHFNSARQTAFRHSGRATVGSVPAACALGSPAGSPISIYFLAAREAPMMIENPRQTSAYHYPAKFGVHSPSFSRACILSASPGTNLFVSGTASIVGYETVHHGCAAAQTRETIANLDALLEAANRTVSAARYSLDRLKFKVYVRHVHDLAAIEDALSASLRPTSPIVYLQADVCREDLLVEIEATGESQGSC